MKKYSFLAFLFLLPAALFAQSDVHFSQFYETSIIRNPALLGVYTDNYRISAYDRNQWSSITNPYQTMMLNLEYRMPASKSSDDFISFGLLGCYDQAGDLNQKISNFYGAINYNKSLSKSNNIYLSAGFTGGYIQYSFDPSKATFNNQFQNGIFDPTNPSNDVLPYPKFSTFDIGAGLNLFASPNADNSWTYILGVSGFHFTQPDFSYYKKNENIENARLNLNASVIKQLNSIWVLQLHGNYAKQGAYNETIAGGLIGWQAMPDGKGFEIHAGCFYRLNDAVIPAIKMKYKKMTVGVSYDVNTSSLKEGSNMQGGYEITLTLSGQYPEIAKDKRVFCARF